jgi:hypothetical protein
MQEMRTMTKMIPWLASVLALGGLVAGCATEAKALDPDQVEKQYGVSGAYNGSIPTPDGPMEGTIIPITLADGRTAQLVIPKRQASDARSVYLVDNDGLHPVELKENATRQDVTSAPNIVQRRSATERVSKKRSWEKEALIIGGSAGGGAAIGAIAGGKKGAGIGAAAGGVGGLIYDVLTRNKK